MAFWARKRKDKPAAATAMNATPAAPGAPPRHKRFLSDQHERYLGYIQAAKTYLKQIGGASDDWLFLKPYRTQDHREFFTLTYNVLNLIEVMAVPPQGRILEVGSGAGWLTEILMGLGYEVFALEPCEDMIAAARERLAGFIQHHRYRNPPKVHHLCEAWRNAPCRTRASMASSFTRPSITSWTRSTAWPSASASWRPTASWASPAKARGCPATAGWSRLAKRK